MPWLGWDAVEFLHVIPGVPLFYLLSGYLLTWTEGNRVKRGNYSLASYAKRRALRILPAYYAAIAVVLLVWPKPTSFWDAVSHLFFVHGLTPYYAREMSPAFWSLTPEVVFYVMLPFVILWLPGLKARLALFAALVLASIPTQAMSFIYLDERHARIAYGEFDPFEFYVSFPTTLLYLFIAGMLIRMLVERLDARPATALRSRLLLLAFVLSAAFLLAPHAFTFLSVDDFGETAAQVQWVFLQHSMLALFFISAVLGAPVLRRLLNWKPLAFVGLISYSMFVFHQTVLNFVMRGVLREEWFEDWVTRSTLHTWGGFLLYLVLVYAVIGLVAYLGFRFIETPFLRLKPK